MSDKVFLFTIYVLLVSIFSVQCKIVEISSGKIEGTTNSSRYGHVFDAFLNIPFAAPPIGELRFQPPLPVVPWDGVLDGKKFGDKCIQTFKGSLEGSEDCLRLNVYTKNLDTENSDLKPVLVYFHGGKWEIGSAISCFPNYLMDRDLVVVTVNYRLGALGFLSVGTLDAVGNMALKDKVIALKWVQMNIEKFGGDPKRVTIAGSSAGAFSVTSLTVSPMSRGLFHGAIAFSGAITFQRKLQSSQLDLARTIAVKLGCSTSNLKMMVNCLKTKPAEEIINVKLERFPQCEAFNWYPVIEPDLGQERFLTEQPEDTIERGGIMKVPIIIGLTTEEWVKSNPKILNDAAFLKNLNENFEQVAPICFSYEMDTERSKVMSRVFRKFYLPFKSIDVRSFNGLYTLLSDGFLSYPVHKFAHLASKFTKVYYYKFSYVGKNSCYKFPHNQPFGAHHGDDRLYVLEGYPMAYNDTDNVMVERMTRIFENFALTGNPNNNKDEFLAEMFWPTLNTKTEFYMDINSNMNEKNGLFLERFAMWENPEDYDSSDKSSNCKYLLIFISTALCYLVFLFRRSTHYKNLRLFQ